MTGHVVACPHCHGPVITPPPPGPPAAGPAFLQIRVCYTRHGYDRQPDFGASVILVPAELREKVPIWVTDGPSWTLLRDEEMDRVCEWPTSVGVRSATADFEGEAAIENLRPGTYWLVVLSYAAMLPVCDVLSDRNPTLQKLSGHFTGLDYGAVNAQKVVMEKITLFPGQRLVHEQCFTKPPGEPAPDRILYESMVMRARRKPSGEPEHEMPSRKRQEAEGLDFAGWCFIGALVLLFLVVVVTILLPMFRGR